MLYPGGSDLAIDESAISSDSIFQKAVFFSNQLPKVNRSKYEVLELRKRVVLEFASLSCKADVGLIPAAMMDLRLNLDQVGKDVRVRLLPISGIA